MRTTASNIKIIPAATAKMMYSVVLDIPRASKQTRSDISRWRHWTGSKSSRTEIVLLNYLWMLKPIHEIRGHSLICLDMNSRQKGKKIEINKQISKINKPMNQSKINGEAKSECRLESENVRMSVQPNGCGIRTWTGAEGNHIGKWAISFAIPGLDFDEKGSIQSKAFDGGRHLIANDAFNDPIAIALGTIGRVENDISCNLAVRLLGRLPIQVDGRWIVLDRNDGEIARR